MLGRVNSIETMACDDGWDIRFAVFLQGCGAKCIYCANVLTWDFNGGELMDSNDIIEQMVQLKDFYKMNWHEIVKYSPQKYDSNGIYTTDEWTSMWDVGKKFDGKLFTLEEYLRVEQRYVSVILSIMKAMNCKYMTIQYLEADKEYITSSIKSSKFYNIDSELLKSLPLLEENRRIHISKITDIIRLSLREYIYVVLCNKEHKLHIKFGYDYYLNVSCSLNCETLKNIVCREGLYLDPR